MASRLARLKGRFVLLLSDRPEVREIFAAFRIVPVALTYTIHGGKGTDAGELIILDRKEPQPANLPGCDQALARTR